MTNLSSMLKSDLTSVFERISFNALSEPFER